MNTKNQISLVRKSLYGIMLIVIFVATLGVERLPIVHAKEVGTGSQYNPLISNSLFLYASTVLDFDTQQFLDQQNGPLKKYSEEINGQIWTAADSITYNSIYYGINPQLMLVLLEAQDRIITQSDVQLPLRANPLADSQNSQKFFYYVKWLGESAVYAFNLRRDAQDNGEIVFTSGESIKVPIELNAGTYGVQTLLAKIIPFEQWSLWATGDEPLFKQKFNGWFGNPLQDPDAQDISLLALPGGYNLPFPVSNTWYYTGGPHTYTSSGARPWSSVDLAPPEVTACSSGSTAYNASRWIVAAKGGTIITSQTALVIIDHGDGWRTYYSHVSTTDRRGVGGVNQNDNIGHPSCEVEPGGSTTGIHVHFAIYQVGTGFVNIAGSSLSDWAIAETSHYNGTMTRQGVIRTATVGRYNGTNDIYNSGSGGGCPAPSLNNPSDGYVSSGQTITFNWSAISGCTFNGYTFRIKDTSSMDSGGSTIVDTGEGGTSRTETIGTQWNNRDLWWGVKAANAPNGASWSVRRFRIEPSGGCPSLSGEVRAYDSTNCGGSYTTANSIGLWFFVPNFNDMAESIAIPSGWSARLYLHDSETSPSACFGGTDTDLWNNTFSDGTNVGNQATWMRVYNNTSCTATTPPNPPSLSSPTNGQYFNEGESITLSWSATGNEYYGEIWGGPGGTLTFGWQSGTSNSIGSQWAGYAYSWHVKARNGSGESGWSDTWTFTVRPAAPTNLSASVASCNQVNLSWSDNSGNEEGYKVYRNGTLIATLPSGTTSYPNSGLSENTSYSYVVKAYRGAIESNASNTANITTSSCPLTPPSLNSPANNATLNRTDSVNLSWNTTSGATQYYAEFTGGPGTNINSGWTSNTSWSLGSQWGGVYQWRVKARNGSGTESGWSETRTLNIKPGTPSNLSASVISSTQINLSWNAPSDGPGNIDGYRIYRSGTLLNTVSSSTTTYNNTGLTCATAYSYTVKAYKGSLESDSSNTANATTSNCGLTPPSLNSPANNATLNRTDSVNLSWNAVSGAIQYYAELSGGPLTTPINSGWILNTSWSLGSQWSGVYQWRVKARNSSGVESDWSETRTLNIKPGAPSNLSATTLSPDQISLTWSASSDAPGNIDGYTIYRDGSAIATVSASTNSYQDNGLTCNTSYSYFVRAYKGSLASNSSSTVNATTQACPPAIRAVGADTRDGNWGLKTSFVPGDPIQWTIHVENTTNVDTQVDIGYKVINPSNVVIHDSTYTVTTGPGTLIWGLPSTVGMPGGTYTFIGSVTYQGIKTERTTTYTVVAPTTTTFKANSLAAQDGWILESTETSNIGGLVNASAVTFNLGDHIGDRQYRAVLSFNTAGLPDNAVITKVTLQIRKQGLVGTNPFTTHGGLNVDIRKPFFGSTVGLLINDFQAAANGSMVGIFDTAPLNNWYSALIGSSGYSYINLTGTTQFRLRFEKDDNDDNGADYMTFFSGNYTVANLRPTLIVEYYLPTTSSSSNPPLIIESHSP